MARLATATGRLPQAALLALAIVAAAVLGACGGSGDQDQQTATAGGGKPEGTLTLWLTEAAPGDWWNKFIKKFEAENPGTEIELTKYTTQEYWPKLTAAFAAGDEPDLFQNPAGELVDKYQRAGKLAVLNQLVDFDQVDPKSLDRMTSENGDIYAIPHSWAFETIWYNKDQFKEAGVSVPKTWDELLDTCSALKATGVVPIAFGNGGADQWITQLWMDALVYQYGGKDAAVDATVGNDGKSWSDQVFVDAASRLKALVDAGCFPKGFSGLTLAQMESLFLSGKAAMVLDGTWLAPQIGSTAKFPVGTFPVPDGDGAAHSTATLEGIVGGPGVIASTKKAVDGNPTLVGAFLNAILADSDGFANENNAVSTAAKPQPTGDPIQKSLQDQMLSAKEVAPYIDTAIPSAVHAPYFETMQELTTGDLTPQEWAKKMAEAVEQERPNFPQ